MKKLIDLSPQELRALPKNQTIFWFAANGLDDRGDHLPLGYSLQVGQSLCAESARRIESEWTGWQNIEAPALPATIDPKHLELGISVRAHVIRDYLVDTCLALQKQGFRYFVVWCGTDSPRQIAAVEDAGRVLLARTGHAGMRGVIKSRSFAPILVCANSGVVTQNEVFESPMLPSLKEHGGTRETAVGLALGLTDSKKISELSPPESMPSGLRRRLNRIQGKGQGYFGQPHLAQAVQGQDFIRERVQTFLIRFQAVTTGTPPQTLFRSWYSVFWPNRSFYKAWLLSLALVGLLVAWLILSLQLILGS